MHDELMKIYPGIDPGKVFITGTPQFDFHFKSEFLLSYEHLSRLIGLDAHFPFILYTTGMSSDFPEEHRHVETVIRYLQQIEPSHRPQLVVRTYIKGTSPEMIALARQNIPDVLFPPILWDEKWAMPKYEDLAIYTSLLHHTILGINAASTVSLELMMLNRPVINLGFDPPGSQIPNPWRWIRHIEFDHYRPVSESGAVMIARSETDIHTMIDRGIHQPESDSGNRQSFIHSLFGDTLDGNSGRRVAMRLLQLANDLG